MTLNGRTLREQAARDEARVEVPLEALALRPTGNRLVFTARPFAAWRDRENTREVHPAAWRVVTPAGAWRRRAFNGLAQVLIQTTGEPGVIHLVATSEGLDGADLRVLTE